MSNRDYKGRFVKALEPVEFKVGDRVMCVDPLCNYGDTGTIAEVGGRFPLRITWDRRPHVEAWFTPEYFCLLRKITDVMESTLLGDLRAEILRLQEQAKERAEAYSQKVNVIKTELKAVRSEAVENYKNYRESQDRAEAAEAKLTDASAILRVMELAKASKVDEWDFTTLMSDVLGGAA